MLLEPASSPEFHPKPLVFEDDSQAETVLTNTDSIRAIIEPYFTIAEETQTDFEDLTGEDQAIILSNNSDLVMTFTGYLKQEAELVYKALDKALIPHDVFPLLRENQDNPNAPHIIHIVEGRLVKPKNPSAIPNIILFILTVFSVLFTGATIALAEMSLTDPMAADMMSGSTLENILKVLPEIWRGYPYAISILLILVPHEMGHYLMMRRHNLAASLPYFIPAWIISPFGTFGAAIMLRETLKNRKTLLDIGAAGPIAGFVMAVPIVIYGLSTSDIVPISSGPVEGNSLIYLFAKLVAFGEIYPNAEADVLINQVAFAGWTGLFVTTLNMIPVGQLDGGHVMYSLFGDKARLIYWPVILGLIGVSIVTGQMTWLVFLIILFIVGRFYAVPLDTITPLDQPRRIVALISLAIFVLTFTPIPLYQRVVDGSTPSDPSNMAMQLGFVVVAILLTVPRWWRLRGLNVKSE